jgi:hypothetical protein
MSLESNSLGVGRLKHVFEVDWFADFKQAYGAKFIRRFIFSAKRITKNTKRNWFADLMCE